jgi:4-carboxymuconolactone decarboxylase
VTASEHDRIPAVDLGSLTPAQQEVADRIAGTRGRVAGPFTVLLHAPELTERLQQVGAYLRYEATLDRDVAETAVLVTAHACGSPFEWEAHEPHARQAGVPDVVIVAVRSGGPTDSLPPRLAAVVDYARELASTRRVSDDAYRALLGVLGTKGTVELTVLVGYYALLAMTLAAHHVEAPDAGPRFFARSADQSG